MRAKRKAAALGFGAAGIVILFLLTEGLLRLMGFGDPPVYDSNPFYGYRPMPNQVCRRFHGATVWTNNLGLRADSDWDRKRDNKVLFLGDSVTYGGSYVDNSELFSALAVRDSGLQSGNAGVNAWGIENIYGLIVEAGFLPAEVYVIVVPEGDFYRGLTRCQGVPFWNARPRLALGELWRFFCYKQSIRDYRRWQDYANEAQVDAVVKKAARRLKDMEGFMQVNGFQSMVFISPTRNQSLGQDKPDQRVRTALIESGVRAIYLVEKLSKLTPKQIRALYMDNVHLSKDGHAMWAEIIGSELVR